MGADCDVDLDRPMLIRASGAGGFIRSNASFCERVGFADAELASDELTSWIHVEDQAALLSVLGGEVPSCTARHRTKSGDHLVLEFALAPGSEDRIVLARVFDPHAVATTRDDAGAPGTVRNTLTTIARIVEQQNPGYKCSILLVADGRFVNGAGPSLPDDYNAAIDNYAVGPAVGSCGTAIYWNVPVVVEDIQTDPLWVPFRELAQDAGVAACWSHPFTASNGRVLGALALYAPEPRRPTAEQLSRLKAAAHMTGLAVERGRAEEALRRHKERHERLEAQLRQAAKMQAIGTLAGGIAHDFNNLLTAIVGAVSVLRSDLLECDPLQQEISDISEAALKAAALTRQLLVFSRQQPVNMARIDVGAALTATTDLLRRTLGEDIVLSVSTPDEPVCAIVDETQLAQIVLNLAVNARDAMPTGGRLEVSVSEAVVGDGDEPGAPPAGRYVRLEVADTGAGIDAETQSRIFEPFFTTRPSSYNTGLGLAVCYGIVEQSGGTIGVESAPGEGASFVVFLPLDEGPESTRTANPPDLPELSGTETVLLIEDEDAVRRLGVRILQRYGYRVLAAADAPAALQLYRQHRDTIGLVFSDVVLPNGNGFELAAEIRRTDPGAKVLLTSGYTDHRVGPRESQPRVLWKPYQGIEMVQAVRETLDEGEVNPPR